MPILSTTSFKYLLLSTGVLSTAAALNFSAPVIMDFANHVVPPTYNGLVLCLRPPYLYLLINFIIFTIIASSKFPSAKDDKSPPEVMIPLHPNPVTVKSVPSDYTPVSEYNDAVLANSTSNYDVKEDDVVVLGLDDAYRQLNATVIDSGNDMAAPVVLNDAVGGYSGIPVAEDVMMSNKENDEVISEYTRNSLVREDSTEYSPSAVKPPVSSRLKSRRNVKFSPEGSKTILGVSKSKKQDTLESTWKTITEGRNVPLTRHLKKSDTWERDNHTQTRRLRHPDKTPPKITMTKADTFNDRTNANTTSPLLTPSPSSGKLKREASLSQDELNRRVEAFIKKFNEDMRLQRQESLNQYAEMIKRGSH